MENNRPLIKNSSDLIEILDLCIQIQNAGIATIFYRFYGHTGTLDMEIHSPVWNNNSDPAKRFVSIPTAPTTTDSLNDIKSELQQLLEKNLTPA